MNIGKNKLFLNVLLATVASVIVFFSLYSFNKRITFHIDESILPNGGVHLYNPNFVKQDFYIYVKGLLTDRRSTFAPAPGVINWFFSEFKYSRLTSGEIYSGRLIGTLFFTFAIFFFIVVSQWNWAQKLLTVGLLLSMPTTYMSANQFSPYIYFPTALLIIVPLIKTDKSNIITVAVLYLISAFFNYLLVLGAFAILTFGYYDYSVKKGTWQWPLQLKHKSITIRYIIVSLFAIAVLLFSKTKSTSSFWYKDYLFYPNIQKFLQSLHKFPSSLFNYNDFWAMGFWILVVFVAIYAVINNYKYIADHSEIKFLLFLLAFIFALYLVRIYPLAPTRHSIVLMSILALIIGFFVGKLKVIWKISALLLVGFLCLNAFNNFRIFVDKINVNDLNLLTKHIESVKHIVITKYDLNVFFANYQYKYPNMEAKEIDTWFWLIDTKNDLATSNDTLFFTNMWSDKDRVKFEKLGLRCNEIVGQDGFDFEYSEFVEIWPLKYYIYKR